MIKRICLYCGSNFGSDKIFKEQAGKIGRYLAEKKIGIVYGGANSGLMGEIANASLSVQGEVIGIIPETIAHLAKQDLTKLHLVKDMHERKKLMFDLADAFIALPGGLGTLEEITEIITWGQLNLHYKPCGFLNIDNYYNQLLSFFDKVVEKQFLKPAHREMILSATNIEDMLEKIKNYQAPNIDKWIKK